MAIKSQHRDSIPVLPECQTACVCPEKTVDEPDTRREGHAFALLLRYIRIQCWWPHPPFSHCCSPLNRTQSFRWPLSLRSWLRIIAETSPFLRCSAFLPAELASGLWHRSANAFMHAAMQCCYHGRTIPHGSVLQSRFSAVIMASFFSQSARRERWRYFKIDNQVLF